MTQGELDQTIRRQVRQAMQAATRGGFHLERAVEAYASILRSTAEAYAAAEVCRAQGGTTAADLARAEEAARHV